MELLTTKYRVKISSRRALFLLLLFVGYYSSTTMFYHSHDFIWGKVVHSHPSLLGSEHSHSPEQVKLIDLLSSTLLATVTLGLYLRFFSVTIRIKAPCVQYCFKAVVHNIRLRAPPVSPSLQRN